MLSFCLDQIIHESILILLAPSKGIFTFFVSKDDFEHFIYIFIFLERTKIKDKFCKNSEFLPNPAQKNKNNSLIKTKYSAQNYNLL